MATDLWFWSDCSGNALYPCARALFWTEQLQKQFLPTLRSWDIGSFRLCTLASNLSGGWRPVTLPLSPIDPLSGLEQRVRGDGSGTTVSTITELGQAPRLSPKTP